MAWSLRGPDRQMSDPYYISPTTNALHPARQRFDAFSRYVLAQVFPTFSVLRDLASHVTRIFPEAWSKYCFRRFWGDGLLLSEACLVIDSYADVRLRNRFRWTESSGDLPIEAADEVIQGTFSPQAAAMLSALFLRYTGKPLRIVTDAEASEKKDVTLICYGTSDFNFKTYEIEAWSGSSLFRLSRNDSGERAFQIGGQLHSIEARDGLTYDKAIVLRLTSLQDSRHCNVICAGLSEWGSLAAVHYLSQNWKSLHQRFDGVGQRRDFCVLLELPRGQFEKAREIASAVVWNPVRK